MADPPPLRAAGPIRKPSRIIALLFDRFRKTAAELPAAVEALDEPGQLVVQARAFQDLHVGDVMKPRADIVALDRSCTFAEVVALFVETEHSRVPVYRDTLDDPVGVVHVKDVFKLLARKTRRPKPEDLVLGGRNHLVRKGLYVPASMRAADLLSLMRGRRTHMALVIDEFGGTDGLITLEDLLERLVGEISDEHDEAADAAFTPIVEDASGWVVDGRTPLTDLEATLGGVDLAPPDLDEEIDTVAGLVTALAGEVPQRREQIEHPEGFLFQVLAADPRRVKRVRVLRSAGAAEPA